MGEPATADVDVVVNLDDFHTLAKKRLDPVDYDYYASGAEDEVTLRRNYKAWRDIVIWPRFLVNVSEVSTHTTFLGMSLQLPVMVAPMAMQKIAHPDGEVGLARAAAAAGALYCITQQATTKMETICSEAPGPKLFQLYISSNREMTESLVRRAEKCEGMQALVITVDSAVLGRRERDIRNKFTPASRGVEIVNWKDETKPPESAGNELRQAPASRIGSRDAGFTWQDLAWFRGLTQLPVLVKGVTHPRDADLAVRHGCSGVWVSNHGGRQLDGGPATADALPGVADAVAGRVPVIVDGGVRRGSDVVRGLALGANIVSVGRPMLWALAAGGERGAALAFSILQEEVETAMALSGIASVGAATRELVQVPGDPRPALPKL